MLLVNNPPAEPPGECESFWDFCAGRAPTTLIHMSDQEEARDRFQAI